MGLVQRDQSPTKKCPNPVGSIPHSPGGFNEYTWKVDSKKQALDKAFERLIGHLHEDFDQQTNPEDMAEQIDKSLMRIMIM